MSRRQTSLRALYDRLNARLFDGMLPVYSVRRAKCLRNTEYCDGFCEPSRKLIVLQSGMSRNKERRVLLHEMCHVAALGGAHGPQFEAQLRRLVARGERWARAEIRLYRESRWVPILDELERLDERWSRALSLRQKRVLVSRAEYLVSRLK